jgi:hypothetical protein
MLNKNNNRGFMRNINLTSPRPKPCHDEGLLILKREIVEIRNHAVNGGLEYTVFNPVKGILAGRKLNAVM